jgi:hypothetical protein
MDIDIKTSPTLTLTENIYLCQQFFISADPVRKIEILECLRKNLSVGFSKIILLNERIYTQDELNVNDEEMKMIEQIIINKRLSYNDFFKYVNESQLNGFMVLSNIDIFFDASIFNLYKSSIKSKKSLIALLRFDYSPPSIPLTLKTVTDCSQDTWIFQSTFIPSPAKQFEIELGSLGCDNKIAYLLHALNYKIFNEPYFVRTYHYHKNPIRSYKESDRKIFKPYAYVTPKLKTCFT